MPDLDADVIAQAAQQPASASQDGRSATAHSIPDQIAADKYQRSDDVMSSGGFGGRAVHITRVRGSGAVE